MLFHSVHAAEHVVQNTAMPADIRYKGERAGRSSGSSAPVLCQTQDMCFRLRHINRGLEKPWRVPVLSSYGRISINLVPWHFYLLVRCI